MAFDIGDDLLERLREGRDARHRVGIGIGVAEIGRGCLLGRIAVGHYDDHRFGLSGRDEVVHDLGDAAEVQPGVLVASVAVQQVEDRIFPLAFLISRRGVNVHAAAHPKDVAFIPAGGDIAMRDVLDAVQVAALSADDEIVHPAGNVLYDGIIQVKDGLTVDGQAVEIQFGSKRSGGIGPYAVPFGQAGGALHEFAGDLDFDGFGILVTERDAVIRVDDHACEYFRLGGNGRRAPRSPGLGSGHGYTQQRSCGENELFHKTGY